MNLPANISTANLPQTYEAAKGALSECVRIDECKDWSDKAAALASYARQSEDKELENMAQRIRARAIRRAGELLKQVEPASGVRTDLGRAPASGYRKGVASKAGMSPHQAKQALRVANVADQDFESQVEGENPPTVSALAQQGITPRERVPILDLQGRDPKEFNRALHFAGDLEQAAKILEALSIDDDLPILTASEREDVRNKVGRIDAIADRIMTRIME